MVRVRRGFVRSSWKEVNELIAASNVYTVKTYGPDRVAGFSPIPAMSMVSYAAGTRYLSLLVFGAVCWYMLSAALDVPTRELQANTLSTLYATAALLVLAVVFCPLFRPSLQINRTDLLAAILFAGVTLARFCHAGPAGAVRYDEVLQAAMLYAALRIIYTAERRTMTVLLMLLCGFGICEAWTGIRQIYGFACSNHSLFRVTGTFFNPGPMPDSSPSPASAASPASSAGKTSRRAYSVRGASCGGSARPC